MSTLKGVLYVMLTMLLPTVAFAQGSVPQEFQGGQNFVDGLVATVRWLGMPIGTAMGLYSVYTVWAGGADGMKKVKIWALGAVLFFSVGAFLSFAGRTVGG